MSTSFPSSALDGGSSDEEEAQQPDPAAATARLQAASRALHIADPVLGGATPPSRLLTQLHHLQHAHNDTEDAASAAEAQPRTVSAEVLASLMRTAEDLNATQAEWEMRKQLIKGQGSNVPGTEAKAYADAANGVLPVKLQQMVVSDMQAMQRVHFAMQRSSINTGSTDTTISAIPAILANKQHTQRWGYFESVPWLVPEDDTTAVLRPFKDLAAKVRQEKPKPMKARIKADSWQNMMLQRKRETYMDHLTSMLKAKMGTVHKTHAARVIQRAWRKKHPRYPAAAPPMPPPPPPPPPEVVPAPELPAPDATGPSSLPADAQPGARQPAVAIEAAQLAIDHTAVPATVPEVAAAKGANAQAEEVVQAAQVWKRSETRSLVHLPEEAAEEPPAPSTQVEAPALTAQRSGIMTQRSFVTLRPELGVAAEPGQAQPTPMGFNTKAPRTKAHAKKKTGKHGAAKGAKKASRPAAPAESVQEIAAVFSTQQLEVASALVVAQELYPSSGAGPTSNVQPSAVAQAAVFQASTPSSPVRPTLVSAVASAQMSPVASVASRSEAASPRLGAMIHPPQQAFDAPQIAQAPDMLAMDQFVTQAMDVAGPVQFAAEGGQEPVAWAEEALTGWEATAYTAAAVPQSPARQAVMTSGPSSASGGQHSVASSPQRLHPPTAAAGAIHHSPTRRQPQHHLQSPSPPRPPVHPPPHQAPHHPAGAPPARAARPLPLAHPAAPPSDSHPISHHAPQSSAPPHPFPGQRMQSLASQHMLPSPSSASEAAPRSPQGVRAVPRQHTVSQAAAPQPVPFELAAYSAWSLTLNQQPHSRPVVRRSRLSPAYMMHQAVLQPDFDSQRPSLLISPYRLPPQFQSPQRARSRNLQAIRAKFAPQEGGFAPRHGQYGRLHDGSSDEDEEDGLGSRPGTRGSEHAYVLDSAAMAEALWPKPRKPLAMRLSRAARTAGKRTRLVTQAHRRFRARLLAQYEQERQRQALLEASQHAAYTGDHAHAPPGTSHQRLPCPTSPLHHTPVPPNPKLALAPLPVPPACPMIVHRLTTPATVHAVQQPPSALPDKRFTRKSNSPMTSSPGSHHTRSSTPPSTPPTAGGSPAGRLDPALMSGSHVAGDEPLSDGSSSSRSVRGHSPMYYRALDISDAPSVVVTKLSPGPCPSAADSPQQHGWGRTAAGRPGSVGGPAWVRGPAASTRTLHAPESHVPHTVPYGRTTPTYEVGKEGTIVPRQAGGAGASSPSQLTHGHPPAFPRGPSRQQQHGDADSLAVYTRNAAHASTEQGPARATSEPQNAEPPPLSLPGQQVPCASPLATPHGPAPLARGARPLRCTLSLSQPLPSDLPDQHRHQSLSAVGLGSPAAEALAHPDSLPLLPTNPGHLPGHLPDAGGFGYRSHPQVGGWVTPASSRSPQGPTGRWSPQQGSSGVSILGSDGHILPSPGGAGGTTHLPGLPMQDSQYQQRPYTTMMYNYPSVFRAQGAEHLPIHLEGFEAPGAMDGPHGRARGGTPLVQARRRTPLHGQGAGEFAQHGGDQVTAGCLELPGMWYGDHQGVERVMGSGQNTTTGSRAGARPGTQGRNTMPAGSWAAAGLTPVHVVEGRHAAVGAGHLRRRASGEVLHNSPAMVQRVRRSSVEWPPRAATSDGPRQKP